MEKGKRVIITNGCYKGKTGIITEIYHGWRFDQFTILLDEDDNKIVVYHDEVKEI